LLLALAVCSRIIHVDSHLARAYVALIISRSAREVRMAKLAEGLPVEDRGGPWIKAAFNDVCDAVGKALEVVGPWYSYGLSEASPLPKASLDSKHLSAALRECCAEVAERNEERCATVIDAEMGERFKEVLSHLHGVVENEGWNAELVAFVSESCRILSRASLTESTAPMSLVYHSVLLSLKDVETHSPSIAFSMLSMVDRWPDLNAFVLGSHKDAFQGPYVESTISIGKGVVKQISARFANDWSDTAHVGKLSEASRRSIVKGRALLENRELLKTLMAE
jgi:hypothetical protein